MCAKYTLYCVLLERSIERENKRQDVIGLTFELRVTFIEAIDKSILARRSS